MWMKYYESHVYIRTKQSLIIIKKLFLHLQKSRKDMDGYTTDETYSDDSESDYQSINEEDFNTKSKTSSK